MNFGEGMTMVINLTSKLEWTPYDYGTMVYQIITETAPPSSWLQAHSFRIFGRTPMAPWFIRNGLQIAGSDMLFFQPELPIKAGEFPSHIWSLYGVSRFVAQHPHDTDTQHGNLTYIARIFMPPYLVRNFTQYVYMYNTHMISHMYLSTYK